MNKLSILAQHQKDCITCMWKILEFIRLKEYKYKTDTENYMMENISVKDIKFEEFQAWIGEGMEVLDSNNIKGRKQSW